VISPQQAGKFHLFLKAARPWLSAVSAVFLGTIAAGPLDAFAGPQLFLSSPSYARFFPLDGEKAMSLTLSSPSFSNGGDIAKKFTCDGADTSPQLSWTDPPAGTKSFALLVDDPDAPVGNWNHWTLWNLPSSARGLPEDMSKDARLPDGSQQGLNDFHRTGYNGPCPPPGKPHRYYFKLFALDAKLDLKAGASKPELEAAIKGHILAQAESMGRFGR
jgi:Raf kinase inhibitor-like YbhB/YbcL family protein